MVPEKLQQNQSKKFKLKNSKRLNNKNSEAKAIRVYVKLGQAEKIASEFLLKTFKLFQPELYFI